MPRYVAFYRYVNFGHAGSPSRQVFIDLHVNAEATQVCSYHSHGNIAFDAKDTEQAQNIIHRASHALQHDYPKCGPAFMRSLSYLQELLHMQPFEIAPQDNIFDRCVTFIQTPCKIDNMQSPKGDAEVFLATSTEAFGVVRKLGKSPGSINAMVERHLNQPATSRSWNTLVKILEKEVKYE